MLAGGLFVQTGGKMNQKFLFIALAGVLKALLQDFKEVKGW